MRHIFILIPSLHPTGPVKGAYALANAMVRERKLTLVTLKPGPGVDAPLDPRVALVSLADVEGGWRARLAAYRALLENAGGRSRVASVSFCLSADILNRFCKRQAVTCASVRGNLLRNYHHDYGLQGIPLAMGHLFALGGFDHVVAMSETMARQVCFYARKNPVVISNFVDEAVLEPYRVPLSLGGRLRFVFLASLNTRKQPLLPLRAIHELHRRGLKVSLDVIGSGPLQGLVEAEVARLNLAGSVELHGHLRDPHAIVSRAHAMILPSLSEGVSRAVLEALHLGVPCVLRAVDGNAELIRPGNNGVLFQHDKELPDAMLVAADIARKTGDRQTSLLPQVCRQAAASRLYLELVEQDA